MHSFYSFIAVGCPVCRATYCLKPLPDPFFSDLLQTNKTIEDLKAIDADIEKLRRQIEDRDLVINRLREESRTKDEQLQMIIMNRKVKKTNRRNRMGFRLVCMCLIRKLRFCRELMKMWESCAPVLMRLRYLQARMARRPYL